MPSAIWTTRQVKLEKGQAYGYFTAGINLEPADGLGAVDRAYAGRTLCAWAGTCARFCLKHTGRNGLSAAAQARQDRTRRFFTDRAQFIEDAATELAPILRRATRAGLRCAARANLLSDQYMLAAQLAVRFPDVPFYDYTKMPPAQWPVGPANYHRTYSLSERTTAADIAACVARRINIACVTDQPAPIGRQPKLPFPATVTIHGHTLPVIDGDAHDLRFLDPSDQSYAVLLRFKRKTTDTAAATASALAAGLATGSLIAL